MYLLTIFVICKVTFKVWYMIDVWVDRLFLHCDRVKQYFEQIGIMGFNSMNVEMYMGCHYLENLEYIEI